MHQIWSPEQYESEYVRIASALGIADAAPARGELEFIEQLARPELFSVGMLPPPDCFFAAAVTSILRPQVMLEIGTGSGFSTAIFAKLIALRRIEVRGTLVHTIDLKQHSAGDETKRVGFAIDVLAPEMRPHITVHSGHDSALAARLFPEGELPFAFVDANHQHPAPLLDVLRVASIMPIEGWILMHDIDLPDVIATARAYGKEVSYKPRFGPQYVFKAWPDRTISGGNIGAVRVPSRLEVLQDLVAQLRELPAEVSGAGGKQRWHQIDQLMARYH